MKNGLTTNRIIATPPRFPPLSPSAQPSTVESEIARGLELKARGRPEDALAAFEGAVALGPTHPVAQLRAGTANIELRRWAKAAAHLRVAVAADPASAEAWRNLALGYLELQRIDEAHAAVERVFAMAPDAAEAWNLRGLVAAQRGNRDEAISHYRRAIALDAGFANAWINLANGDQASGRLDVALEGYERARSLDPASPDAHYNIGNLFHKSGRAGEALAHYRQALALRSDHSPSHNNLAHALLLLGRFDEAWREYLWRPTRTEYIAASARAGRPVAPLSAAAPGAARVTIVGEQGLGDVLFFLRYAPLLQSAGTPLDFVGSPRLAGMLRRTGLFDHIVEKFEELAAPAEHEVLAGDLPLVAQGMLPSGEVPPPLALMPEPALAEAMRQRLAAAGPPPYVGLAWRAGFANGGGVKTLHKAVAPAELGAAHAGVDATFVSLQREPAPGETEALSAALGRPVHDFSAVNHDLEAALALVSLLDDSVGISNTLVHLRAGIPGKTGRVLVPFPAEWRWLETGDSPWFPGFEVYRQDAKRNWNDALAQLAARLRR